MTDDAAAAPFEAPVPSPCKVSRTDEDVGGVVRGACTSILANPDQASLKRLAWAYGCSKKGSDEEQQLLELLIERVKVTAAEAALGTPRSLP